MNRSQAPAFWMSSTVAVELATFVRMSSSAGFSGEDAEGEEHDNGASENEGGAPDEVGPDAGFEAADKDIDGGKDGDEPAHGGEAIEDGYGVVVFGDEFGSEKMTDDVVTKTSVTMAGMAMARRATPSNRYWRNSGMV